MKHKGQMFSNQTWKNIQLYFPFWFHFLSLISFYYSFIFSSENSIKQGITNPYLRFPYDGCFVVHFQSTLSSQSAYFHGVPFVEGDGLARPAVKGKPIFSTSKINEGFSFCLCLWILLGYNRCTYSLLCIFIWTIIYIETFGKKWKICVPFGPA